MLAIRKVREVGRSGLNERYADPPTPIALKHHSQGAEGRRTLSFVLIIRIGYEL
jgi:hypothetical protein